MTGRHTTKTLALSTALAVLCALGCSSSKRIAKANDALRIEREELKERVVTLEGENAELHVKIAELMQTTDSDATELLAATPRIASIELSRFSTIWSEGGASEARFYVVPKDGMGRFVQATGTIDLRVVATGAAGNSPEVLLEFTAQPTEIRDAYTAGIGGAAYEFLQALEQSPGTPVVLQAQFHDSVTGTTHTTEKLINLRTASFTE